MRHPFFADVGKVLGAMSKALATLITQPLIVAKVGLQSRPPAERHGKPFESFTEVMRYIIENEGPWALFKGFVPQIIKGILVQGLLMMTKERYAHQTQTLVAVVTHCRTEILFALLFAYLRKVRSAKLQKLTYSTAAKPGQILPVTLK